MATNDDIQYKEVKNPAKPGRAPAGCVWVKEGGELLRNDEGQIAYRPMTAAERRKLSTKKSGPRRVRTVAPAEPDVPSSALLKKRTYRDLSYGRLEQVRALVTELIDKEREAERTRLEAELAEVQERLRRIE